MEIKKAKGRKGTIFFLDAASSDSLAPMILKLREQLAEKNDELAMLREKISTQAKRLETVTKALGKLSDV